MCVKYEKFNCRFELINWRESRFQKTANVPTRCEFLLQHLSLIVAGSLVVIKVGSINVCGLPMTNAFLCPAGVEIAIIYMKFFFWIKHKIIFEFKVVQHFSIERNIDMCKGFIGPQLHCLLAPSWLVHGVSVLLNETNLFEIQSFNTFKKLDKQW